MAETTIALNDPTPVLGQPTVAVGAMPGKHARTAKNIGWYVFLTFLSLFVLFPVWMTLVRALSTPVAYVNEGLPLYPVDVEWGRWSIFGLFSIPYPEIFSRAFTEGELGRRMALSAVMTIIIATCQLVTSVLCAYAFAFLRFPLKRLVFVVFMATLMLPIEVTLIPNVTTIRNLEWLDSYQGLTVPFLATAFGIFLIRQGFMGIPKDLLDAAKLDGYGHFAFMARVAVPITRPVVASFGVISLLAAWNQYLWPRAVVTVSNWETVQIGLKSVAASNVEESNIGFAAAIIAALPVLALLIFLQRHLIRGLTAGAVKG